MHERIFQLADQLGLSDGQVLKLARDISHDGALVSVAHLRKQHLEELCAFLEKAAQYEAVTA